MSLDLAVAIAECCFSSLNRTAVGAKIGLVSSGFSNKALLFSESPSRIVISFAAQNLDLVKTLIGDCPFVVMGTVGSETLEITVDGESIVNAVISDLELLWKNSLEKDLLLDQ